MIATKLKLIKKSLLRDGFVGIRLEGQSMEPLIKHGTSMVINSANHDDIKISDIVAFEKDGNLVVHQYLYKAKRHVVTWGINNRFTDGKVGYKDVLGKVSLPVNTNLYNHWLFSEATVLNGGLKKIKANPIWIKGPVYSMYLYGHFLNFKTPDLDVLINRRRFGGVKKYLLKCGYVMKTKKDSGIEELPYAEITFVKKLGKVKINLDVHLLAIRCTFRRIFPKPLEPYRMVLINDELIKHPIKFKGFILLNDTSGLFHLCTNLMLHHAGKGIWDIARIAQLINLGKIDWNKFVKMVFKYGLGNHVYYPLNWARNIFGAKIPIIAAIKPVWYRHFFARLLLNRLTVCRTNRLLTWMDHRFNAAQIFYLRIVLSLGVTPNKQSS